MRAAARLALMLLAASPGFAIEVTTGFLIGPKYDPRAFYVRASPGSAWQKTYTGSEFRRQAQGKLLGVRLPAALLDDPSLALASSALASLRASGALMTGIDLQGDSDGASAFAPDGSLRQEWFSRLDRFLRLADSHSMVVALVLFHHSQDENFDSPNAILAATHKTTAWLIERGYRNVILSIADNWSAPGWDHDGFVTQHLEELVGAIRDQFQARKTDYALPVALTTVVHLAEESPLIENADLMMVGGDGLTIDPRKIERPQIVLQALEGAQASERDLAACSYAFERSSGWLLTPPSLDLRTSEPVLRHLAQLTLARPARNKPAAPK